MVVGIDILDKTIGSILALIIPIVVFVAFREFAIS